MACLLYDLPTTYLHSLGVRWYRTWIASYYINLLCHSHFAMAPAPLYKQYEQFCIRARPCSLYHMRNTEYQYIPLERISIGARVQRKCLTICCARCRRRCPQRRCPRSWGRRGVLVTNAKALHKRTSHAIYNNTNERQLSIRVPQTKTTSCALRCAPYQPESSAH